MFNGQILGLDLFFVIKYFQKQSYVVWQNKELRDHFPIIDQVLKGWEKLFLELQKCVK